VGIVLVAADVAVLGEKGVPALGGLDHLILEAVEVVGAEQAPRLAFAEREVQQRLVHLALGELGRRAARPDHFTDAERMVAARALLGKELAPRGDDPRRIAREPVRVGEADAPGVLAECLAQQLDPLAAGQHEHRLIGRERAFDRGQRTAHEAIGAFGIEDHLMTKRVSGHRPPGGDYRRAITPA